MNARVRRADAAANAVELQRDHAGEVGFHHLDTGRRVLAHLAGDVCHAGGEVLLRDVDLTLHRGEHVRVAGNNGAGKTSLVNAILGVLAQTSEQVGLLPQMLTAPTSVIAEVVGLDPDLRGRVLGTLATLGVDPDRVLVTDEPSPGEVRKLALARFLSSEASVIVLDEPTNHLDLPSIERLERALGDWPGALLLVTHDDTLASSVTHTTWTVADGHVTVSSGPREDDPR